MPLIELQDISKTYVMGKQHVAAVSELSLTIDEGEFTVLAGPSGSGKTTALNLMGGLDRPCAGFLNVAGCRVDSATEKQLADFRLTTLGFIFQAYNLIPVLSAAENAEFVLQLKRVPADERRERVDTLFRELGMDGLQDRRPGDLSGGQQQRVAVIRAMASEPALVLADEPTANLDSRSSTDLLDMMRHFNETKGTTFVFSSHDSMVIERARRVITLQDGQMVSDTGGGG